MRVEPDGVWTLIPLISFLWSMGGSGPRHFRRYGFPLAVMIAGFYYQLPIWIILIQGVVAHGITRLPYGDKSKSKLGRAYFAYIFFLGFVYGASSMPLGIYLDHPSRVVYSAILCMVVFGGATLWSQKAGLIWKAAEILTGLAVGYAYASTFIP